MTPALEAEARLAWAEQTGSENPGEADPEYVKQWLGSFWGGDTNVQRVSEIAGRLNELGVRMPWQKATGRNWQEIWGQNLAPAQQTGNDCGPAAAFGVGLTRTFGAFLVLALASEYFARRDRQRLIDLRVVATALPAVGVLAVLAYARLVVGDQRYVVEVSSLWGDRMTPAWETIPASVNHIISMGDAIEALNLVCLVAFTLLGLLVVRKLPLGYGIYVWSNLALLYSRQSLVSPARERLTVHARSLPLLYRAGDVPGTLAAGRSRMACRQPASADGVIPVLGALRFRGVRRSK